MARENEDFLYDKFVVGERYDRMSVMKIGKVTVPQQARDITGITRFNNSIVLFVTLDKSNKEKAHRYNDTFLLDGKQFFWESQNSNTPKSPAIQNIINGYPAILFVRIHDKIKGVTQPFIFAGKLKYLEQDKTNPVEVLFEVENYQNKPNALLGKIYAWSTDTKESLLSDLPKALMKVKNSAQGRMTDSKKKKAIELHAMKVAIEYYQQLGYDVKDTSSNCPYDLECFQNESFRRVEVKGTMSTGQFVNVTRNEVRDALSENCETDLFIVSGIEVSVMSAGKYITDGGKIRLIANWKPKAEDLEPTMYRYNAG